MQGRPGAVLRGVTGGRRIREVPMRELRGKDGLPRGGNCPRRAMGRLGWRAVSAGRDCPAQAAKGTSAQGRGCGLTKAGAALNRQRRWEGATVYYQANLARERQQGLLASAAAQREAQLAQLYTRISRQAERAERLQLSRRDQALRLRGRLE